MVACKRKPVAVDGLPAPLRVEHPAKEQAAVDAGVASASLPVSAGSIRGRHALYRYAVYHPAAPRTAPTAAASAAFAGKGIEVSLGEPGKTRLPDAMVYVSSPPIAAFQPPAAKSMQYSSKGLSPEDQKALVGATSVTVFEFSIPADQAIKLGPIAYRGVAEVARATGGILWDDETRVAYSKEAWSERAESFHDGTTDIRQHMHMHLYRDGDLYRLVTLGMSKFALPDLAIEQVTNHDATYLQNLINLTGQTLLDDPVVTQRGALALSIAAVHEPSLRKDLQSLVTEGGLGKVTIAIDAVEPKEGDAPNRLVEIAFHVPASERQKRQREVIATLFGVKDSVVHIEHDAQILAAVARAKKAVLAYKARYADGPPDLQSLTVKAPFRTDSDGNEWMWVEVTRWKGHTIYGVLQNEPYEVKGLKQGARVEVEEGEIFDYRWRHNDGRQAGGEAEALVEAASGN